MKIRPIGTDRASDLSWSPTEEQILYCFDLPHTNGIAVIYPDGTGQRKIVSANAIGPCWSPDGRQIAFWGYRYPLDGLCLINEDESDARVLYPGGSVHGISWSPNGRYLAFSHEHSAGKAMIVLDMHSSVPDVVFYKPGRFSSFSWSSTGQVLYYSVEGKPGRSTYNFATHMEGEMQHFNFCWSPQGDFAVVPSMSEGIIVTLANKMRYTIKADSASDLEWSLDGTQLMFTANVPEATGKGPLAWIKSASEGVPLTKGLFVASRGSTAKRLIIKTSDLGLIAWQTISPNGRMIAFTNGSYDNHQINIIDL
jgi:Tol biopolymer transport system component